MHFYKTERTILLIDGQSLYDASRGLGFEIDYKKLLTFFRERTFVVRSFYFAVVSEGQDYLAIRPLLDWLEYNGFAVVAKTTKPTIDPTAQRRRMRGNIDMLFAVEALQSSRVCDHLVLFTSHADYAYLIDALKRDGKRVSVVSTIATQPPLAADELRRSADQFIELATFQAQFARQVPSGKARATDDRASPDDTDF